MSRFRFFGASHADKSNKDNSKKTQKDKQGGHSSSSSKTTKVEPSVGVKEKKVDSKNTVGQDCQSPSLQKTSSSCGFVDDNNSRHSGDVYMKIYDNNNLIPSKEDEGKHQRSSSDILADVSLNSDLKNLNDPIYMKQQVDKILQSNFNTIAPPHSTSQNKSGISDGTTADKEIEKSLGFSTSKSIPKKILDEKGIQNNQQSQMSSKQPIKQNENTANHSQSEKMDSLYNPKFHISTFINKDTSIHTHTEQIKNSNVEVIRGNLKSPKDSKIKNPEIPTSKIVSNSPIPITASNHHDTKKPPKFTIDSKKHKAIVLTKDQKIKLLEEKVAELEDLNDQMGTEIIRLRDEVKLKDEVIRKHKENEIKRFKNVRLPDTNFDIKASQISEIEKSIVKNAKTQETKLFLNDAISKNDYLQNLDITQIKEIIECMELENIPKGQFLFREGEEGDNFYIVESGTFELYQGGSSVGVLKRGNMVGEAVVLYKCLRTTSCVSDTDGCSVWKLDRRTFKNIMFKCHYKLQNEYAELLRNVPFLEKISDASINNVINIVQELKFDKMEVIYEQGSIGKSMYVVKEGSVSMLKKNQKQGDAVKNLVKILGRGSFFGERALFFNERRLQEAKAGPNGCVLLSIDSDDFVQILELTELDITPSSADTSQSTVSTVSSNFSLKSQNLLSNVSQGLNRLTITSDPTNKRIEQVSYAPDPGSLNFTDIRLEHLKLYVTFQNDHFSRLDLCYLKNSNSYSYLLKCFKKHYITENNLQQKVLTERKMLNLCNSPFIIQLHKTYRDKKFVHFLMEGCTGGDIHSLMRLCKFFDEMTARFYCACVIEAFIFLHRHGIVYRSLRTECLFIDSFGYLKLTDLCNVKKLGSTGRTWTFIGHPEYVAPEIILNKGYDTAVDFWALGILIHELVVGHSPFHDDDSMKTYNLALKGMDHLIFPKIIGKSATALVKKLCKLSPSERIGYQRGSWVDVRKHKWFEGFDWVKLGKKEMLAPTIPNIRDRRHLFDMENVGKGEDILPDDNPGWDKDF